MKTNVKGYAGKFVFVSGIAGGREVFLGRAIDEPFSEQISLEGKPISYTPQGVMIVRPFTTVVTFPVKDPNFQIQYINNPTVIDEINNIFNSSLTQISRANYPLTFRWIEASIRQNAPALFNGYGGANRYNHFNQATYGNANAFYSFYSGFATSAEQFRRALFQSPQVNTTKELDKITELEGDLTIEIGKVTNEIAVKFNHLINRDGELINYFEWIQGYTTPILPTNLIGGWAYLINRLQVAKNWARRNGKTPLVREINNLMKEGINRLNEAILDHCSSLDTLITETCNQYGIQFELYGEMSPFMNYTGPFASSFETYNFETPTTTTTLTGVGV